LRTAAESARISRTNYLEKLTMVAFLSGTMTSEIYDDRFIQLSSNFIRSNDHHHLIREAAKTLNDCLELTRPGRRKVPMRQSSLKHCHQVDRDGRFHFDSNGPRELWFALKNFDAAYLNFVRTFEENQVVIRNQRRARRAARREIRVRMAAEAFGLQLEVNEAVDDPTVLSTLQLCQRCLFKAIQSSYLTDEEVLDMDPRCFVVLPRLCLLWGIEWAKLPKEFEGILKIRGDVPLAIFLPRICRTVGNALVLKIRNGLSNDQRLRLARLLVGQVNDLGEDEELSEVFRFVAAASDRSSQGRGARGWSKVLGKLLNGETEGEGVAV